MANAVRKSFQLVRLARNEEIPAHFQNGRGLFLIKNIQSVNIPLFHVFLIYSHEFFVCDKVFSHIFISMPFSEPLLPVEHKSPFWHLLMS